MAIALDAVNSAQSSSASSLTFALTVGSGADRYLFVGASAGHASGVTGVTFNGVAMTELWNTNAGGDMTNAAFGLVAPDSGTFNVVVSFGGTGPCVAGAVSFTGVDQTTPNRTPPARVTFATSTPSINVTTVADDMVIDNVCAENNAASSSTPPVAGANQTRQWHQSINVSWVGAGSTELATGTTTTMSWTLAGSDDGIIGALALIPATGGGGASILRQMLQHHGG